MKKILLFALLSWLPLAVAHAQIPGKSSDPNLEVSIKRVTDMGNGTFRLNLFVTNHGKEDLNKVFIDAINYNNDQRTQAYDDEGNTYGINSFVFTYAGESRRYRNINQITQMVLPKEVPVKVIIDILDVDEFATELLRFDLILSPYPAFTTIQFKNISLPRKQ